MSQDLISCPVCQQTCKGKRGLSNHFRQQRTKEDSPHLQFEKEQEEAKWSSLVEGDDYVCCLVEGCDYKGVTLARHLKASHGITAKDYREQFGQGVLVRSRSLSKKRSKASAKSHQDRGSQKGETKTITCPECNQNHEVSKFFAFEMHNPLCSSCKDLQEGRKWEGKSDPEDYVTCQVCGYRAESLTSHLQHSHPDLVGRYQEVYPEHHVVSLNSKIRDASYLKGIPLSQETRDRMSENAGRWNKGLTKETDERVARSAENRKGYPSWSKGLIKDHDERLAKASEKLKRYVGDDRPWDNGLKVDLELSDFEPFLDEEGRVDRRLISDALSCSWKTIRRCMKEVGVQTSNRYIQQRAEDRIIRLEKETLEAYALGNGKISIARAMRDTGHTFGVIKRECQRHGLETFSRLIRQTLCLDAVSEALGGLPYKMEWESRRFCNPPTGRMFRFDGYFPDLGLIVEFHGHQHWMFPSAFIDDEQVYLDLRERDRIKKEMIEGSDTLKYFEVREDEPYDDPSYLRGRLFQLDLV